jgi:MinD-like ATPase involved in chromosome partitioning or flagellar assembly
VNNKPKMKQSPARTVAFISNKGGVGKTHISVNLAIQCAREGRRVLLADTDLGSANADTRLGVRPSKTLLDFYERRADIFQCLTPTNYGVHFLAGRSGEFALANLAHSQKVRLMKAFDRLVEQGGYDEVFFDLGAGIGSRVLDFALVADECVIVATPTDIVAAYSALKATWIRFNELREMRFFKERLKANEPFFLATTGDGRAPGPRVNFIVNQVDNLREGKQVFLRILDVSRSWFYQEDGRWGFSVRYLGGIPYVYGLLREAERARVPAIIRFPHDAFSHAIREISGVLLARQALAPDRLRISFGDRVRGVLNRWATT